MTFIPRILAFFVLLISMLFWPLWISVVLALAGMIYFKLYLEAVLLFFLSDLLYGAKEAKFFGTLFISFTASAVVLIIIEVIKRKLRFYDDK
jgi:hypothetical protein